jgi:cis-3-alkyl-4-acyloxetan-2-one decarboxylase
VNQVLEEFLSNHPGREFVVRSETKSPFAERKATLGDDRFERRGLRLHYIDEGEGEPVVMLHGNPSWSFLYRNLIEAVRGSHRVVVPDHIGCGLSDKPDDSQYSYTLKSRVDDLEALLDHLGLDRDLTLVLHDWGGMIGMTYAARHPERIARLVVANTAAFHLPVSKALPMALAICRSSILAAPLVRGANAFCHGTALIGCKRARMPRDLWRAYVHPYDSWAHRIAILRFVQDIPLRPGDPSYDLVAWVQDRLHLLASVPMLILWGMRDFVFDHHFLEEWERRFPAAEVHRFGLAGHYLFEDEVEATRALAQQFLTAQPAIRESVG